MNEIVPINDIERMAKAIVSSKLFGVSTPDQAVALMLIAQAEGSHPAIAARDYHIIQGRPTLKADAMLARFIQSGGKVEWHTYTDTSVSATFTHNSAGSITVDWDMERAKKAGLGTKDMWKKYPRQMLRSRVISEGIRSVYPGANSGLYTPEEVIDFEEAEVVEKPKKQAKKEEPKQIEQKKEEPEKKLKREELTAEENAAVEMVEEVLAGKMVEPGDVTEWTLDKAIAEMEKCKNKIHLTNWHQKHRDEIRQFLNDDELRQLGAAFSAYSKTIGKSK